MPTTRSGLAITLNHMYDYIQPATETDTNPDANIGDDLAGSVSIQTTTFHQSYHLYLLTLGGV